MSKRCAAVQDNSRQDSSIFFYDEQGPAQSLFCVLRLLTHRVFFFPVCFFKITKWKHTHCKEIDFPHICQEMVLGKDWTRNGELPPTRYMLFYENRSSYWEMHFPTKRNEVEVLKCNWRQRKDDNKLGHAHAHAHIHARTHMTHIDLHAFIFNVSFVSRGHFVSCPFILAFCLRYIRPGDESEWDISHTGDFSFLYYALL